MLSINTLGRVLLLGLFLGSVAPPLVAQSGPDLEGTWEGAVTIQTGAEVKIVFHIEAAASGWTATWDSPDQGAVGLPAGAPTVEAGTLTIPIPVIQGRFVGDLGGEGDVATGTFHQGPAEMALELRRTSSESGRLVRPQEPTGPVPYREEEVEYPNPRASGVTLAGTLTVPQGAGPFPAVVLISGSGPQDRNEALAGHKPFLVLADYLTRQGIAVLRYDDRGVAGSTGDFGSANSMDFAGDVQAGVEFLTRRPEVAANRIGLVGHSEGGLIAPLVANATSDVANVVMLAGPGLPGDEILMLQSELIARADNANEAGIRLNQETQRELFRILKGTTDPSSVRQEVRATLENSVEAIARIDQAAAEEQRRAIPAQVAQLTSPWFHFFLSHDPRTALRSLKQPVLAINGSKDLQVPPGPNLEAIRSALTEASNTDVTVHEMEGLNHLFQAAGSGAPSEYATLEETFSPRALQAIAGWILERVNAVS